MSKHNLKIAFTSTLSMDKAYSNLKNDLYQFASSFHLIQHIVHRETKQIVKLGSVPAKKTRGKQLRKKKKLKKMSEDKMSWRHCNSKIHIQVFHCRSRNKPQLKNKAG